MESKHKIRAFSPAEIEYVKIVKEAVCRIFRLTEDQLSSSRRYGNYTEARKAFTHILRSKTDFSLAKIGQALVPVNYKEVTVKRLRYTEEELKGRYITDHSSVSISLKGTKFILDPSNSRFLTIKDKAFIKKVEKLSERLHPLDEGGGNLYIGRVCYVNKEPGVVTRIYPSKLRVLFTNEEEGEYPTHVVDFT